MANKELAKQLVKQLVDDLRDIVNEESHVFDETSNRCKVCKEFNTCKMFHGMGDALRNAALSEKVIDDCIDFLDCIKHEAGFVSNFNFDGTIRKEIPISNYYKRFEQAVDDFKHYNDLVRVLNNDQLSYIRKVIMDTNNVIADMFSKIEHDNRNEMNFLIKNLRKTEEEPKRYEDMTKEELIAELNKK